MYDKKCVSEDLNQLLAVANNAVIWELMDDEEKEEIKERIKNLVLSKK